MKKTLERAVATVVAIASLSYGASAADETPDLRGFGRVKVEHFGHNEELTTNRKFQFPKPRLFNFSTFQPFNRRRRLSGSA